MELDTYKQALDVARRNMDRLLQEREVMDAEISKLTAVIESLTILCEGQTDVELLVQSQALAENLRDAMRLTFKAALPSSLSPTQVRDKLREGGFPLDRYKYELPPIHNTIARLEAAGEIEAADRPDGEKAYKWVSVLRRAAKRAKKERENNRLYSTLGSIT